MTIYASTTISTFADTIIAISSAKIFVIGAGEKFKNLRPESSSNQNRENLIR